MSDLGNAAISDSGNGAMLASIVEKWPVDPRQAGDAIRQYRTMTFFAIALEGVTGLIILALAIITLLRAWETLGFPTIHPAVGYLLLLATALILLEIIRQFRIRGRLRSITGVGTVGNQSVPRRDLRLRVDPRRHLSATTPRSIRTAQDVTFILFPWS